jgi:hypothetical protein
MEEIGRQSMLICFEAAFSGHKWSSWRRYLHSTTQITIQDSTAGEIPKRDEESRRRLPRLLGRFLEIQRL